MLGALDALAELVLLIVLLLGLASLLLGAAEGDLAAVIMVAALLPLEKAVSVYHARHYVKEFLPVEHDIRPVRAA